jgi:hypothetical protein
VANSTHTTREQDKLHHKRRILKVLRAANRYRTEINELLVCSGSVKNVPASWMVTTWTKIINTESKYPLTAISAKSAVLGMAESRKIKEKNRTKRNYNQATDVHKK